MEWLTSSDRRRTSKHSSCAQLHDQAEWLRARAPPSPTHVACKYGQFHLIYHSLLPPGKATAQLDTVNNVETAAHLARELAGEGVLVTRLSLEGSCVGDSGADVLAQALARQTTLRSLDLYGNGIGPLGAHSLARALLSNRTLCHLGLGANGIGPEGAASVAEALLRNESLTSLHLNANQIGPSGAASIATALQRNRTLITLGFGRNGIGPAGLCALAAGLHTNRTLQMLALGSPTKTAQDGAGLSAEGRALSAIHSHLQRNRALAAPPKPDHQRRARAEALGLLAPLRRANLDGDDSLRAALDWVDEQHAEGLQLTSVEQLLERELAPSLSRAVSPTKATKAKALERQLSAVAA